MRQPSIGQKRNVGERNGVADQKSRRGKLMLHPRQRRVAALDLVGVEIGRGFAEIDHLETAHRDIRLVAVLLPEQPFIHLRRRKSIAGDQIAAAGEIFDDGVGFRKRPAVVEFDRRHLPRVIELEEFRRAGLAVARVDFDPVVGDRKPVADKLHLQAIARIAVAVDFHGRRHFTETTDQQAVSRLSTISADSREAEKPAQNL